MLHPAVDGFETGIEDAPSGALARGEARGISRQQSHGQTTGRSVVLGVQDLARQVLQHAGLGAGPEVPVLGQHRGDPAELLLELSPGHHQFATLEVDGRELPLAVLHAHAGVEHLVLSRQVVSDLLGRPGQHHARVLLSTRGLLHPEETQIGQIVHVVVEQAVVAIERHVLRRHVRRPLPTPVVQQVP